MNDKECLKKSLPRRHWQVFNKWLNRREFRLFSGIAPLMHPLTDKKMHGSKFEVTVEGDTFAVEVATVRGKTCFYVAQTNINFSKLLNQANQ